jgi:hypothetical protein
MNREIAAIDESQMPAGGTSERQRKMTNSARSIADITAFSSLHAFPAVFVLAASTLAATLGTADARGARSPAYDGTWNVVFVTRAGNCSSTNSAPFTVSGRRLYPAGGGKVTGGISSAGLVSVRISVGRSVATGSGRLLGNSGAGRWSGIISGDRCSGIWQATRS